MPGLRLFVLLSISYNSHWCHFLAVPDLTVEQEDVLNNHVPMPSDTIVNIRCVCKARDSIKCQCFLTFCNTSALQYCLGSSKDFGCGHRLYRNTDNMRATQK